MGEEIKVEPSEDLAYWIGVLQTDGHVEFKDGYPHVLSFMVSKKSVPMLERFRYISGILFKTKSHIFTLTKRERFCLRMGVKRFASVFEELDIDSSDPPIPPEWVLRKPKFFGAYLAGIIDGDGDVTYKRSKYPQLLIRITSGKSQKLLSDSITRRLKCSVKIYQRMADKTLDDRKIHGQWFELHFLVSSKTYKFFKEFALPYMQLDYKKAKIESYINSRWITN